MKKKTVTNSPKKAGFQATKAKKTIKLGSKLEKRRSKSSGGAAS